MTAQPRNNGPRRLTKEEAGEAPELHHVWSEELQAWVPLGQQVAIQRYEQENDPGWQLTQYKRRRDALLAFIRAELAEAEYESRGYPVSGKLHDYYTLPDYDGKKALTKQGAAKLASLLRLRRGGVKVTQCTETPEFVGARVSVQLVDSYGQAAGAHEAAASTAERGFQGKGARRKYGAVWREDKEITPPDYRAAMNDVVARAGKRAFVGAVIVAASVDEIFDLATSTSAEDRDEDAAQKTAPSQPSAPAPRQKQTNGLASDKQRKLLYARAKAAGLSDDELKRVVWAKTGHEHGREIRGAEVDVILAGITEYAAYKAGKVDKQESAL